LEEQVIFLLGHLGYISTPDLIWSIYREIFYKVGIALLGVHLRKRIIELMNEVEKALYKLRKLRNIEENEFFSDFKILMRLLKTRNLSIDL